MPCLMHPRTQCVYTVMCVPLEQGVGKEGPKPHLCKLSNTYVPVFSSIAPEEDEDAFCSTQNTHLKWLSQWNSFPILTDRGGICRERVRAIETFCSCWSQKQSGLLMSIPSSGFSSARQTPRDEFSCPNTGIVSFVLEYLQHLCGLEDNHKIFTWKINLHKAWALWNRN